MKLFDLFEQTSEPLAPGEKRFVNNVTVRDLEKIERKLSELQDVLYHSESLKDKMHKDPVLVKTLTDLIIKVRRKRELLSKVQARPTTSQMNIVQTISRECSDFLNVIKHTHMFLYRGIRNDESVFEGRSRDDRATKDSKSEISDEFDKIMAAHGVTALRHNSIFTTTNSARASGYGHNVYMIFPKNGFHFLSTTSADLILDSWHQLADHDAVNKFVQQLKSWIRDNNVDMSNHSQLDWYISVDRVQGIFSEIENNFYAYDNNLQLPEEFNKSMEDFVSSSAVIERFEPNTTDLASAMLSQNEILINGEYWALKRRDWMNLANTHFLSTTSQYEVPPKW